MKKNDKIIDCVGIIGLGVGNKHLINLYKNSHCKEIIIFDYNFNLCEKLKNKYKKKVSIAKNENAIFRNKNINLVVIASYDNDHCKHILKAIKNNKNIFCEKPLCVSNLELNKISDSIVFNKYKKNIYVNHVLRSAPLYKWLKKNIENNKFGKIYYYEGQYLYGRIDKILSGWRGKDPKYSAFHGGAIHLIDLLIWILNIKPTKVRGFSNKFYSNYNQSLVKDFYEADLFHSNNMKGKIIVDLCCSHKHQHVLKIFGTKKCFIYDDMGARIFERKGKKIIKKFLNLRSLPITKTDHFFQMLNNNKQNSLKNIFNGISIANYCVQADKKNKEIKISYKQN